MSMNAGASAVTPPHVHAEDEVERMLGDSASALFKSRHQLGRMKLNAARPQSFDRDLWREIAELGWLRLRLSESLGGQDLGLLYAGALSEQFGAAIVPEPYIACSIMPTALCSRLPRTSAVTELANEIAEGRLLATLAWQERAGQEHSAKTAALLTRDGRITGRKVFVPNADICSVYVVSVSSVDGFALALVRHDAPGLVRENHRTGDGSQRAHVTFESTPIELLLGESDSARFALECAIDEGTLASAAYQTGLARKVHSQLLEHLKTRVQFDRPLGAFQTLQHLAADLYMAGQLSRASWRRAAQSWDIDPASALSRAAISAAKSRAAQAAQRTARAGVQILGGLGFAEEADVGLALRVALQHSSWLGSSAQHLRRFAHLSGWCP
jgi:Acyl-CoA dehydrogenases